MLRQLSSAATAAVLMAAVLAGCGDDGITLPDERAASAIEIEGGDGQTATVGAPLPDPVRALVTDAQGSPVANQRVEFSVSGGGTATPTSVQTDENGIAATQWVLGNAAGGQTLTARPVGNGAATVTATAQAVATAGPAVSIAAVSGSPQSAVAGTTLPGPLVVQVEDAFGNGVPGVQVEWTVVGAGSVSEPSTLTDDQGQASVTRTLGTSTGSQVTEAAVDGLEGSPVVFEATATVGSAGRLSIERQPSSTAQSGSPFGTQPQIQLRDASNNPVADPGIAIQAELASGPATATLIGTPIAATNAAGLATFTNLGITGPAGEYTINFSGSQLSLTGVTSGTITIAAGAPTALRFATQPASTTAGATISPPVRVELIDAQGNVVTGQNRTVSLQLQGTGGTLSGTTSATTSGGVATFSNLSVSHAGTYTLRATATGVNAATSTSFSVSPGAATQLAFITQPSAVDAGEAISPAVRVEARDAGGNLVTSFSGPVTIAIANNPGDGTLSGTVTVNASGGVATFADLSIDHAGSGYTLQATSTGLSAATSSSFNVRAGSGASLEKIAGDNEEALVGTAVVPDPSVRVTDANDNPVSGVTVTFTVASGGGSVSGGTQTTNSSGVATVGSWTLGNTAGTNTLTASAPGAGSVTFTATARAGSGSGLEFHTPPPASIASGAPLTPIPVVQIVDAEGNDVAQSGVPITIAVSSGASLSGTTTRTTDSNGRATFSGMSITGPVGDYTLTFSGQGTPISAPLSITPGNVSGSQSSVGLSSGTIESSGTTTVTVTAEDGQGNPIAGASVALSVAPGPGTFGNASLTTASNGTASTTFSSSALGTHTISATITGAGGPVTVTTDVEVQASGTTTNIIGHEPNPSAPGEPVVVSFEVTSASGDPAGTVLVTTDEGADCQAVTSAGQCSLTFNTAGTWTITAAYQGGGPHSGSSGSAQHQVNAVATEVLITGFSPEPATAGQSVSVAFSVSSALGPPPGVVSITTSGPDGAAAAGDSCEADISAGSCELTFETEGQWVVTATYDGTAGYLGDTDARSLTVVAPPPDGTPADIEIRRQPSTTARSGEQFSRQPEIRVRDGSGNNLAGVPVRVALATGGGTLGGRTTDVTRRNGVGSWDDLRIDGIGVFVLEFTAGRVVSHSTPIVVSP